jgi:hypothetical protein
MTILSPSEHHGFPLVLSKPCLNKLTEIHLSNPCFYSYKKAMNVRIPGVWVEGLAGKLNLTVNPQG